MRRHHLLVPLAAFLLAPPAEARLHGADAERRPPVPAAQPPLTLSPPSAGDSWRYRYSCDVERQLPGGTVSLTRLFTDDAKLDAGDFMRWTPRDHDPQRAQRPLDLELSYIWEMARQPAINARAIDVNLRVGIDTDLPEVALLHIQRPFPVLPHGIIGSTALSTQVFPYSSSYNRRNGHGELPLGDLLAYADGYDRLDWTLIHPSDKLGGGRTLAKGTLDIAALRDAVAALPALRDALLAKADDPKARCDRRLWPVTPPHP